MSYIYEPQSVVITGTKSVLLETAAWAVSLNSTHPLARVTDGQAKRSLVIHSLHDPRYTMTVRHQGEDTVYAYAAEIEAILPLTDLTSNEREELLLSARKLGDRPIFAIGQTRRKHGILSPKSLNDIAPLPIAGIISP